MNGYPKNLNTREDYEYVLANFPREDWEQDFCDLLVTVYEWENVGKLKDGEEGITDETHRVEVCEMGESTVERYQYEYKENPNAKIFRIGYTVDEVKEILGE